MAAESVTLNLEYTVDSNLVLSADELVILYLTDIPLRGLNGDLVDDNTIEFQIGVSTSQLEGFLSIKIPIQKVSERQDFNREWFNKWGNIQTNYIVNEVTRLQGLIKSAVQVTYPKEWVSIEEGIDQSRGMHIIPAQGLSVTNEDYVATYTGQFPLIGYASQSYIPKYWSFDYTTGWAKVPADIINVVGKLAVIQVLNVLGDITFGAGIANFSISLDGVSQSIGTTHSPENALYSAHIKQFLSELKQEMPWLKKRYMGIGIAVA